MKFSTSVFRISLLITSAYSAWAYDSNFHRDIRKSEKITIDLVSGNRGKLTGNGKRVRFEVKAEIINLDVNEEGVPGGMTGAFPFKVVRRTSFGSDTLRINARIKADKFKIDEAGLIEISGDQILAALKPPFFRRKAYAASQLKVTLYEVGSTLELDEYRVPVESLVSKHGELDPALSKLTLKSPVSGAEVQIVSNLIEEGSSDRAESKSESQRSLKRVKKKSRGIYLKRKSESSNRAE